MWIKAIVVASSIFFTGINMTHAHSQHVLDNPIQQNELNQVLTPAQAREAILKMAGEYEVNFRFEETYALKNGYQPKNVKLSKGNELVIVIENSPEKISLQHLLMVGKHVVKHWRQDWVYQPKTMWSYIGHYQWKRTSLTPVQSQGQWLQTVWQVDDSPRYAGLGQWRNNHGVIEWTSNQTYRPLPRRETTTRNDYDVIVGVNRQALTAKGWIHEQDNVKYDSRTHTAIVHELGINTYNTVSNVDFKPALDYWTKHKQYWAAVRQNWATAFDQNEVLGLRYTNQKEEDKNAHYMQFFKQSEQLAQPDVSDKILQNKTKTLLNQELTIGQVK